MDFNPNHSKSVLNENNVGVGEETTQEETEDTQEKIDDKESKTRPEQDDKRLNKKGKEAK